MNGQSIFSLQSNNSHRLAWIDKAKALGIFLVAYGHILQFCDFTYSSLFYNIIYGFHMPLFFFLSGITYKDEGSYLQFVLKKAKHILLPSYIFILINLLWQLLFQHADLTRTDLKALLFYTGHSSFISSYWFLGSLFVCECAFALIRRLVRLFSNRLWPIAVLVAIFYGATYLQKHTTDLLLPFFTENMGYMLPFFALGVFTHTRKEPLLRFINRLDTSLASIFLYGILMYYYNSPVEYWNGLIGNPIVAFLKGFLGIQLMIYIALHIEPLHEPEEEGLLCRTGRNSLYIYGLHYIGFLEVIDRILMQTEGRYQFVTSLLLTAIMLILINYIMVFAKAFLRRIHY